MKQIDADKLLEILNKQLEGTQKRPVGKIRASVIQSVVCLIEKLATEAEESVEREEAEWQPCMKEIVSGTFESVKCSACGESVIGRIYQGKYCRECGRKMKRYTEEGT